MPFALDLRQVLIPDEELESSSQRWHGRAVLLSWPSGALQLEVREETQNVHQAVCLFGFCFGQGRVEWLGLPTRQSVFLVASHVVEHFW